MYFWPIKKSTNKQHKQQNMQTTICTFYPKIQFSIQNYVFCPYKTYQNFQSTLSMWGLSSNENIVRTWDYYQLFAVPLTMQWWIGFKCTLWVPLMISFVTHNWRFRMKMKNYPMKVHSFKMKTTNLCSNPIKKSMH
jgi:hypothetical protein